MNNLTFALVGAGAWGLNLLKHLLRGGVEVSHVAVLDDSKFRNIAPFFPPERIITNLALMETAVPDVVFLTVPDDLIVEVARGLPEAVRENSLVVHCAGSVSMEALQDQCKRAGVFYPLQTFTVGRYIELNNVPFWIEANNLEDEDFLMTLGKKWSQRVEVLPSDQRLRLHCGAVFAGNFVNHCLALSDEIIRETGMDYRVYLTLVQEVVAKLESVPPTEAQTGPAVRSDFNTMSKHLDLLVMNGKDGIAALYTKMNQSIQRVQKEKVHN